MKKEIKLLNNRTEDLIAFVEWLNKIIDKDVNNIDVISQIDNFHTTDYNALNYDGINLYNYDNFSFESYDTEEDYELDNLANLVDEYLTKKTKQRILENTKLVYRSVVDTDLFIKTFEDLVGQRFYKKEDIGLEIKDHLGFKPNFEEKDLTFDDHNLISNCEVDGEELCYLDVYYIKDNGNKYYITEVGYDFNT